MKKLLTVFLMMFALSLIFGCSAKESGEDMSKEPSGTQEAESMDTTAMDSTMMSDTTVQDTTM